MFSHPRGPPWGLNDSDTAPDPNPCWCPGTGGPGEELEPGTASTHQPGQGEAPPEAPRAPLSHCQLNFHVNLWKILVFSIYKVFAYLAGDVPVMPLSVSLLLAVLGWSPSSGDTRCSRVWSQLCKSLQANHSAPPSLNFMLCRMETKITTILLLEGIVKTTVWGAHGALEIGKMTFNSALFMVSVLAILYYSWHRHIPLISLYVSIMKYL